jgi:hypothetical protein
MISVSQNGVKLPSVYTKLEVQPFLIPNNY